MTLSQPPDDLANARAVSPRWVKWRQALSISDYEARFVEMDANGTATHGEADFIEQFRPNRCLDAGCGTGRVAIELARRGVSVMGVDLDADMLAAAKAKAPLLDWSVEDLATMRLSESFDLIAMPGNVMIFCKPTDRATIVANLSRHLTAQGLLIAGFSLEPRGYSLAEWDVDCVAAGLVLAERYATWDRQPWYSNANYHVSVHQRR
jgi:SAM-dependent methyltransferase